MALITPVLKPLKPIDATKSNQVEFQVAGGNQVTANRLLIESVDNNSILYNNKISSFSFTHEIPANTLTNGAQYRAKIKTYDVNNNESEWSDGVLFWCLENPTLTLTIPEIVNSSSIELQAIYNHSTEQIQSYRYYLYRNKTLVGASIEKYDTDLKHTFSGLLDNEIYQAEIRVYTVNGMTVSSGLVEFSVDYISPIFHTAVVLENVAEQASIKVNIHVIDIVGEVISGTADYENDTWINLKNGVVSFSEGFNVNGNFTLKFWCKDMVKDVTLIELLDKNENSITIMFCNNRFHVCKRVMGVAYFIYSDEIVATATDTVCCEIKSINDLMDISCQVVV